MQLSDRNINILVTGGAGYIGSHTCLHLARAGFTPVTLDDLSRGWREFVRWGPFVEGRVQDETLVRQIIRDYRIAGILHFAAYAYVGESTQCPESYYANNLSGSVQLFEAALAENVRTVVFSSSCTVYGNPGEARLTEDSPTKPISPYGETKLAIERFLYWLARAHKFRYVALRYFNAAGADYRYGLWESHEPETHLIPKAIQSALNPAITLEIFGNDYPTPDGTAIRDYVHVNDLAEAHVKSLQYLLSGGRESLTLNLGSGGGHSVLDILRAVERVAGRAPTVSLGPRREGDPPAVVADARLADTVLRWRPQQSSLAGIVRSAYLGLRHRQEEASVCA